MKTGAKSSPHPFTNIELLESLPRPTPLTSTDKGFEDVLCSMFDKLSIQTPDSLDTFEHAQYSMFHQLSIQSPESLDTNAKELQPKRLATEAITESNNESTYTPEIETTSPKRQRDESEKPNSEPSPKRQKLS